MSCSSVQTHAIMFADIAGSTRLYETLGDQAAKERVTRVQQVIVETAAGFRVTLHEVVGDEVMLCFGEADDAVAAALAIQRALDALSGDKGLSVRIGLHCGEVIVERNRLFGDTINVAARVAAIAQGGQIILTQPVVDRLPDALRDLARRFDVAPVKGKRDPLLVYDLPWQPQDLTEIAPLNMTTVVAPTRLTLTVASESYVLDIGAEAFSIGRDASNQLVVDWPSASRHHAYVQFVRGRFVIADTSTNGTFVTLQNDEVVFLRRESLPLWGQGHLALGAAAGATDRHRIDYHCG